MTFRPSTFDLDLRPQGHILKQLKLDVYNSEQNCQKIIQQLESNGAIKLDIASTCTAPAADLLLFMLSMYGMPLYFDTYLMLIHVDTAVIYYMKKMCSVIFSIYHIVYMFIYHLFILITMSNTAYKRVLLN